MAVSAVGSKTYSSLNLQVPYGGGQSSSKLPAGAETSTTTVSKVISQSAYMPSVALNPNFLAALTGLQSDNPPGTQGMLPVVEGDLGGSSQYYFRDTNTSLSASTLSAEFEQRRFEYNIRHLNNIGLAARAGAGCGYAFAVRTLQLAEHRGLKSSSVFGGPPSGSSAKASRAGEFLEPIRF